MMMLIAPSVSTERCVSQKQRGRECCFALCKTFTLAALADICNSFKW